LVGELKHPYQHPYAVASIGRGLADARRRTQDVA
jgi:hypothetical protein